MIRKLLTCLSIIITFWLGGFGFFVYYTKSLRVTNYSVTDLIAVIAGGRGRIETSVKLLNAGYAPLLFISGAKQKDLKNYMNENKVDTERLVYGLEMAGINKKVAEIVEYINLHNIRSLRIVTAAYNMPRILEQTRELVPASVAVIAHPIVADYQSYKSMFKEYNEYIKTYLMYYI